MAQCAVHSCARLLHAAYIAIKLPGCHHRVRVAMLMLQDEGNNVLRGEPRSVTVQQRLLGRGAYMLMFDSAGSLLVSQRSESKVCDRTSACSCSWIRVAPAVTACVLVLLPSPGAQRSSVCYETSDSCAYIATRLCRMCTQVSKTL
jgi:hypothetical protein